MHELAERIAALVGDEVLHLEDTDSRWPALGALVVDGVAHPVALYLGLVRRSQRQRDDVERRFQNPAGGHPILAIPGRALLLLGLWDSDDLVDLAAPLLVSADPTRRIGATTRFSVFARLSLLRRAVETGWAEESLTGETMRAFLPALLPVSFSVERTGTTPDTYAIQAAIESSGLLAAVGEDALEAARRVRQVGSRLARDSRFSKRVIDAYGGFCAMCGLDIGLVQGAHIYPVSAPGAHDEPWNGLALCGNHHLAFDRHVLGVRSETREIVFHQTVLEQMPTCPAVAALVGGTFPQLAEPQAPVARPRPEMFERRYEFFRESYEWLA